MIYENTATISGSGADVFSDDPGTVSLSDSTETLTSLFHSADMTFGGWCHDNTTEGTVETPVTLTGLQYLTLTATITPEPAPTPDDDDDTPAVTPSQPRHSGSNGSGSTSKVTATKPTEAKHSLSCGKAVLDTTKTAYLLGYADGLMGNDDLVTRGQAAQVIYRLLTEDSLKALHTVTNAFPDVSDTAWYNEAVSTIAAAGVIVGGSDGNYHPDSNITWAEMTTIFTRFTAPCADRSIITRHWAKDALNTAISHEWIDYKDTFEPDAAVTRAEFISFINTVIAWATETA